MQQWGSSERTLFLTLSGSQRFAGQNGQMQHAFQQSPMKAMPTEHCFFCHVTAALFHFPEEKRANKDNG